MTQPEPSGPPPMAPPPAAPPPPGPSLAQTAGDDYRERQSFGEQAAKFSLYVPLAAILINCVTRGNNKEPGVAMAVGWINLALIVAGFVLGIAALVSMRFYGRRRILGRAVVGVIVNGLLLAAAASFLLPAFRAKQVRERVIGAWRLETAPDSRGPAGQLDITFKPDGTFRFTHVALDGTAIGSTAGQWIFTHNQRLALVIQRAEGGTAFKVGETVPLGQVRAVDDRQLVLKTDKGDEVFHRLP